VIQWSQDTPLGPLRAVMGDAGLVHLSLPARDVDHTDADFDRHEQLATELDEYFAGTGRTFSVPIDLSVVAPEHFGRRVLETLHAEVPWGETVSYGELADMVGAPRAARAVGNVMRHTTIAVVVPCHRVIAADGSIGGYGGDLEIKRALLAIEGIHPR
jgi:methylated-DNA-[protein]-cysteine S-methyltransferase